MLINLKFEIETKSPTIAIKVVESVSIDINSSNDVFDRSLLKLFAKDQNLILEINSKDISSAKASINTSLKWIENSINIIETYQSI